MNAMQWVVQQVKFATRLQLTDRCEVRSDGLSLLLLTRIFRDTFQLLALHVTVFIAVMICNGQSVDWEFGLYQGQM